VLPTILDLSGIEYEDEEFDGKSLINMKKEKKERVVFCESGHWQFLNTPKNTHACIIRRLHKYILCIETGKEQLYNLKEDPGEKENIADKFPVIRKELTKELNTYLVSGNGSKARREEFDKETLRQLKKLGYVDDKD